MLKIKYVECQSCGDKIFSRARHDFRYCSCKTMFVDGGFDYCRVGGDVSCKVGTIELDVTKKELYDDWNNQSDTYGLIKTKLKDKHNDE